MTIIDNPTAEQLAELQQRYKGMQPHLEGEDYINAGGFDLRDGYVTASLGRGSSVAKVLSRLDPADVLRVVEDETGSVMLRVHRRAFRGVHAAFSVTKGKR